MRLVFEDLARSYVDMLQAKLRNFSVGPEFLDTWVYEEDAARSLFALFESASNAKLKEDLTVAVGTATVAKLDVPALKSKLEVLGRVSVSEGKGGIEVTVAWKGGAHAAEKRTSGDRTPGNPDPRKAKRDPRGSDRFSGLSGIGTMRAVTEPYRAGIERATESPRREGEAKAGAGETLVAAEKDGIRLSLAVDAAGTVRQARHRGAKEAWRGVLDALCTALEGRPLQEGADHGVIRAEDRLRDRSRPRPVSGILVPGNADPVFRLPESLIRAAFKDWVQATGWKFEWNFHDDGPGEKWAHLAPEARLAKAEAALREACGAAGVQTEGVGIVDIVADVRIVLHFEQDPAKPKFGPAMIGLERRLKDVLDPRIELQMEGIEDRNQRIGRTKRAERAKDRLK